MSLKSLNGVWNRPSITFPDHADFMCIDEERGRIISFVAVLGSPIKYATLRHWFHRESPTSISAKLQPGENWLTHNFDFEGECVVWAFGAKPQRWTRMAPEGQPDWFATKLAAAHAKMDAAVSPG